MISLGWLLSLGLAAAPTSPRVMLVVANTEGSPGDPVLRYSRQDAAAFTEVFASLGGVDQIYTLEEGTPEALEATLQQLRGALPPQSTFFFFYSGHADGLGLKLRGGGYPFVKLRQRLDNLGARLFIAVLDACQSGSLVRAKGGTAVPALDVALSGGQVTGGIYITSSGAAEVALESDELQASYFTHAWLMGLRGAADQSGDGQVTLEEAYQFAFEQTLTHTRGTLTGPQHPTFSMQVAGEGALVLTWLRRATSYLVLGDASYGDYTIRQKNGRTLGELQKNAGAATRLALSPGHYQIIRRRDGTYAQQDVALGPGEQALDEARMVPAPLLARLEKGGTRGWLQANVYGGNGYLDDQKWVGRARVAYVLSQPWGAWGFGLIGGGSTYRRPDAIDVRYAELGLQLRSYGRVQWGPAELWAGGSAGISGVWQQGEKDNQREAHTSAIVPLAALLGAHFYWDNLQLSAALAAGGVLHPRADRWAVRPQLGLELGIGWPW